MFARLAVIISLLASSPALPAQSTRSAPPDLLDTGETGFAPLPAESRGATLSTKDFDAGVGRLGFEVIGPDWELGLRLTSWGRRGDPIPVPQGEGTSRARSLHFERPGLREWIVKDSLGLEHGFTLQEKAKGENELQLGLTIDGDFVVEVLAGGRDARFTGPVRIMYAGLVAWDAAGRELPAEFRGEGHRLAIVIEDANAAYPITVDPWIYLETAVLESSQPGGDYEFGRAVGIEGDSILIGEPQGLSSIPTGGYVHAFERSGSSWVHRERFTSNDNEQFDVFGYSLARSGNRAVIGAPGDEWSVYPLGAAYVFESNGTSWVQQAKLVGSTYHLDARFGFSVALDGNTALVGASCYDHGSAWDAGAVFVFVDNGTSWEQQAILKAVDRRDFDYFGGNLALDGDTAFISACGVNLFGNADVGAVYVFRRQGTAWSQEAKLRPADHTTCRSFGSALAVENETLYVGAERDETTVWDTGSCYLFRQQGTVWNAVQKLVADDPQTGARFGRTIAVDNGLVLIGAPMKEEGASGNAGAAYLFGPSSSGWQQKLKLALSNPGWIDYLGAALDLVGNTLLIGAPGRHNPNSEAGLAYVYEVQAIASHSPRHAGANPISYSAVTEPYLGGTYQATVDLGGTTGHPQAVLAGFGRALTFPLGGWMGLVDPTGAEYFGWPISAGPVAAFGIPIPSDPAFAGFEVCTQAVHLGGGQPFALSNAQDLFLGF